MSSIVIYENLGNGVKKVCKKSAKEVFSPLLESWKNIISTDPSNIDIQFDKRFCKDFEPLMRNTLPKSRLDGYENAHDYYQGLEMWIDVCISYTDRDERTHRFVFFVSHPSCMTDGDFNSAAFGMEIADKDGNVCDSITYSVVMEQGKTIALQDMFEELGLTAESKPLVDFIVQERQNS